MKKYKYSTKRRVGEQDRRIRVLTLALLICLIGLMAAGIAVRQSENDAAADVDTDADIDASTAALFAQELFEKKLSAADLDTQYLENVLGSMSIEEKVGQLFLVRSNGVGQQEFCELISAVNAGGVVIFANDIADMDAQQVKAYIAALNAASGQDLLVCVDEEGGSVVRVSSNQKLRSQKFQSPQKLYSAGGLSAISDDAAEKSAFLLELGFNVNFAPVADVVTDKDGFLYSRSFGKEADETAEYVSRVVAEMRQSGIGSCLKHFPGYGNSSGDTHKGLVYVDTGISEIKSSYLAPFRAGIEAGADAVMVTHSVMTAIDADRPASLSEKVISLLRDELSFDGVIITDGMDMGAVIEYGEEQGEDVCVLAFIAGCDLICTPTDAEKSYNAMLEAVRSGKISQQRLDESVYRIIKWKLQLSLAAEEK